MSIAPFQRLAVGRAVPAAPAPLHETACAPFVATYMLHDGRILGTWGRAGYACGHDGEPEDTHVEERSSEGRDASGPSHQRAENRLRCSRSAAWDGAVCVRADVDDSTRPRGGNRDQVLNGSPSCQEGGRARSPQAAGSDPEVLKGATLDLSNSLAGQPHGRTYFFQRRASAIRQVQSTRGGIGRPSARPSDLDEMEATALPWARPRTVDAVASGPRPRAGRDFRCGRR